MNGVARKSESPPANAVIRTILSLKVPLGRSGCSPACIRSLDAITKSYGIYR